MVLAENPRELQQKSVLSQVDDHFVRETVRDKKSFTTHKNFLSNPKADELHRH